MKPTEQDMRFGRISVKLLLIACVTFIMALVWSPG